MYRTDHRANRRAKGTYLNDFNGGVVNSSRGIIKYYQKFEDGEERFAHYTREAVLNMRKDIYGE